MNLDEAIQAHTAWKIKLAAYLRHPDDSIDQAEASNDHRCPLGQWLHGEAKKTFGSSPEYADLVAEHARFHRAVGYVINAAKAGTNLEEAHLLGGGSEFATSSQSVIVAISKLRKVMAAA